MLGAYTTFVVQAGAAQRGARPQRILASSSRCRSPSWSSGAIGVLIERCDHPLPLWPRRSTRCWRPGACRWCCSRPCARSSARPTARSARRRGCRARSRSASSTSPMAGSGSSSSRCWCSWRCCALLRRTPLGLYMRAVTQNRPMAAAMGIRTPRVDALTFGLGSGIAGLAGVALSQIDNVSPNLGQGYIIDSFMVVVFGGVGNLFGTLVGALTLGVVNKFLEPYAGAVLGKILVLVFIILFIQRRPRGLFALKGRSVGMHEHALPLDRAWAATCASSCCWCWRSASSCRRSTCSMPQDQPVLRAGLCAAADRQVSLLRVAGAGGRPGLGLLRHPLARPRRLLRAGRLLHGHVPDAPDRRARRLRQSDPARLHGVPELPELPWFWHGFNHFWFASARWCHACRACWRWRWAGSPSAAASPASICRSSPRR